MEKKNKNVQSPPKNDNIIKKEVVAQNSNNPIDKEKIDGDINEKSEVKIQEEKKKPEKKNPLDVEIVEPEEINDFYNFVDFGWEGTTYNTTISRKHALKKKYEIPNPKLIKAFIPGTIQKVFVTDGTKVKKDEKLIVLEAMKMKNNLLAPFAGEVKKVHVKQGQLVAKNQVLVELK